MLALIYKLSILTTHHPERPGTEPKARWSGRRDLLRCCDAEAKNLVLLECRMLNSLQY